MSKWAERLAASTASTDERGLLSVLTVPSRALLGTFSSSSSTPSETPKTPSEGTASTDERVAPGRRQRPQPVVAANADMHAERSCWPNGPAANTAELAAMEKHLRLFERRRVPIAEAARLADRLLARDRELDDRHLCIECTHGTKARCPGGAPLGGVLQRCPAFTPPEEPA